MANVASTDLDSGTAGDFLVREAHGVTLRLSDVDYLVDATDDAMLLPLGTRIELVVDGTAPEFTVRTPVFDRARLADPAHRLSAEVVVTEEVTGSVSDITDPLADFAAAYQGWGA